VNVRDRPGSGPMPGFFQVKASRPRPRHFLTSWVFLGLQAQDPAQANISNPEHRYRPRQFKNTDL